ncbi:MAG: PEP-CTERM sorting domain-containing protein [Chlorobaculum sp.]|jgi:hypothetical protein|nr:PEP-CTERM sorting domain-containing protein [Chlorobaculum sp.]
MGKKKLLRIVASIFVATGFSSNAHALVSTLTTQNPVMDGVVSVGEWNGAGYEADGGGLAGAVYAEWKNGLDYGSYHYDGTFSFLLHNIEQNTTYDNGGSPAYNVFDVYAASDSVNKYLEITARYNGFTVNKYNSSGVVIDTAVFDSATALGPDQTDSYVWGNYFGVYAKGGYGNSAYTSGLPLAIDNSNQIFEVAYLTPDSDFGLAVRRSMKDPDQLDGWKLKEYLDTTTVVPEPSTTLLMGLGIIGMGYAKHRKAQSVT